jgi:hypothetical protein
LKRIGFIALGVAYGALGWLALHLAWIRARHVGGFPAAFRYLLQQPYGEPILVAIAAGLAAFTLGRLSDVVAKKTAALARIAALVDAAGHALLAWLAIAVLFGVRRGGSSRYFLARVLELPWGAALLLAVGAVVIAVGAVQLFQGVTGRLARKPATRRIGRTASGIALRVGRFGYATRGIVTGILGWFLVRVALEREPQSYRGLGGALGLLQSMQLGGILLAVAGAGLAAYGAYLVLIGLFGKKL